MKLATRRIPTPVTYTGRELRSGWIGAVAGLEGDAAVAFVGPCHVANEDLVDLEDRRAGTFIRAARMLHVIAEHPDADMDVAVLRQRLLVCLLVEALAARGVHARRSGDDVFVEGRKLTVSIAAPATRGALIHLGVNVDPAGAPVAAVGLDELGVDPDALADDLLDAYARELASCAWATTKVREVP